MLAILCFIRNLIWRVWPVYVYLSARSGVSLPTGFLEKIAGVAGNLKLEGDREPYQGNYSPRPSIPSDRAKSHDTREE